MCFNLYYYNKNRSILVHVHSYVYIDIKRKKIKKLSNKCKNLGESLSHEGGQYIMENFYEIMTPGVNISWPEL